MSRAVPRFGEVFEYRSDGGKILVMWIGPPMSTRHPEEFTGICLRKTPKMLARVGEVADYLALIDPFEDEAGFGKWFEVPDSGAD